MHYSMERRVTNMGRSKPNLECLMEMLASRDGMVRQKARESLVALEELAVPSLIETLQNSRSKQVRWEAAKALGAICDIRSIPTLVKALEDKDPDVAWLAAEALKRLGKAAWPPILHALVEHGADSVLLRRGARHVYFQQRGNGFSKLIVKLRKSLGFGAAPESVPLAANELLQGIESTSRAA
jgi:HEAT repeat protein